MDTDYKSYGLNSYLQPEDTPVTTAIKLIDKTQFASEYDTNVISEGQVTTKAGSLSAYNTYFSAGTMAGTYSDWTVIGSINLPKITYSRFLYSTFEFRVGANGMWIPSPSLVLHIDTTSDGTTWTPRIFSNSYEWSSQISQLQTGGTQLLHASCFLSATISPYYTAGSVWVDTFRVSAKYASSDGGTFVIDNCHLMSVFFN